MLFLAGIAAFIGRGELELRELSRAVDAHVVTYQRQRWERPVLRGDAVPGNAAHAAQAALDGFTRLPQTQREQLAELVFYGRDASAEQSAWLDSQGARIARLRAATQSTFAVTSLDPAQPQNPPPPDYVRVIDAVLMMLADASRLGPEGCLMQALDTVRLGQDLVPGAELEAASISMRVTSLAAPVIARCTRGAPYAVLLARARELHNMATHPPPSFGGIELADTQMLVRIRDLATAWPVPRGESPLARIRRRPTLFAAFKHFDKPARWRALSATDYPNALQGWLDEQEWRDRSEVDIVREASIDVTAWLFDDMRGQALLRVLTVGMATLAERENRQRLPREPLNLADPAMRDPFNGRPLSWRVAQDGSELTLWSTGEDRRDDKGSSEWSPQAPVDVTVHFPLLALRPAGKEKTR